MEISQFWASASSGIETVYRTLRSPTYVQKIGRRAYQITSEAAQRVSRVAAYVILAHLTYRVLDKGIADLLCLETLQHGTGPKGFYGISTYGADPNYGGCASGSTAAFAGEDSPLAIRAQNYFYVFKDTQLDIESTQAVLERECSYGSSLGCFMMPWPQHVTTFRSRIHAITGSLKTFEPGLFSKELTGFIGALTGLLTPTLRFRFKPEDLLASTTKEHCIYDRETQISLRKFLGDFFGFFDSSYEDYFNPEDIKTFCMNITDYVFENDPDYGGLAYKTSHPISPDHLGMTGSWTYGLDETTALRMVNNPVKALSGLFLIITTLDAMYLLYKRTKTNSEAKPVPACAEHLSLFQRVKATTVQLALRAFWMWSFVMLYLISTL